MRAHRHNDLASESEFVRDLLFDGVAGLGFSVATDGMARRNVGRQRVPDSSGRKRISVVRKRRFRREWHHAECPVAISMLPREQFFGSEKECLLLSGSERYWPKTDEAGGFASEVRQEPEGDVRMSFDQGAVRMLAGHQVHRLVLIGRKTSNAGLAEKQLTEVPQRASAKSFGNL